MDGQVGTLYARARAARPDIDLPIETFATRVAALPSDGELCIEDLYLAWACAAGSPDALAVFEREIVALVPQFVARFHGGDAFVDEVRQLVRERLLVGASPRIATYGGRGPLGAWVRVTATRIAVDLVRARGGAPVAEAREDALAQPGAADLELLKARYRDSFQDALDRAIAELTAKQRTLLRMHHVDGFTLDRLATIHRVHRATIARWLAEARDAIVAGTHRILGARFAMTPSEVDSLTALVQSQLHLSIERVLPGEASE